MELGWGDSVLSYPFSSPVPSAGRKCWEEVEGQRKQTASPHVTFPSEHSVIHLVRRSHFSSMLSVGSISASSLRNQQSPVRGVKPPTDPQLAPHAAFPLCPHLFVPCCSSPWKAPVPNSSTFFPLSMKICGHRQEPSSASLELVGGPCASFPGHLTTASLSDAQSHLVALGRRIRQSPPFIPREVGGENSHP